jgi:small-conductance mechanosensitive channel
MLNKRETRSSILRRYVGWTAIRVAVIVALFILLESLCQFGYLGYLGDQATQDLIYMVARNLLLSSVVWFFLALSKKILIPATVISVSPAIGKIVHDKASVQKTNKSITNYLTYLVYAIIIVALVLIWAYAAIGTWIASLLGNGLVIMVTFILGLFSSSVLGNVLGYAILGGTNEFKVGDRVQIGDSYGDIAEIGVFFTRIKTIKDEIISVPNLTVMGKEIRNFSALKEVLIYIPITLGYDIDKDQARKLLIESARRTKDILLEKDRDPFVLFRDLGNYSITYEINAYTDKPNELIEIKSELIDNILTDFKMAGIEIMSPMHIATRASQNTALPLNQYIDAVKTKP